MNDLTPQAMIEFATHHGVATHAMLASAGVGRRLRARLIEAGVLAKVHDRVVRITSTPFTIESRCAALCLAHPAGFVTGPTAGRLLGLRRMPSNERIDFSVPHGLHLHTTDDVRLRQSTRIDPLDTRMQPDGIRLASPARLLFDLAVDLDHHDLCSVLEQMLDRRLCTMSAIGRVWRQLVHPARPGSMQFVRAVHSRGESPASQSHLEVLLDHALRSRGVPVERQVRPLALPSGMRIRLDLAVPAIRWGIEIDVHPDHLLVQGTTKDKRRDRQCHLIGWQIERLTELDLLDVENAADELEALYRARRRAIAA